MGSFDKGSGDFGKKRGAPFFMIVVKSKQRKESGLWVWGDRRGNVGSRLDVDEILNRVDELALDYMD